MTDMTVTNQTTNDYWFGPLHLPAGVGQTLVVDVTSNVSLYLTDDTVADALNNLYVSGKIMVTNQPAPFPRATGVPQILHGDGSPDGRVFAPQGSAYMRRDNTGLTSSLYVKTTGITSSTGWQAISTEAIAVPTGIIQMWAGPTAPSTDWLICDGSAVSRSVYSALYAVTLTAYGVGDGSTTFNLPDLRGRVAVGYASGGHSDVATLGLNEGSTLANRRPRHPHTNGVIVTGAPGVGSLALPNHAHSDTISYSDTGHGHGVSDPSHAHTLPEINTGNAYQVTDSGAGVDNAGSGIGSYGAYTGITVNSGNASLSKSGSVGNPTSNPAITGAPSLGSLATGGTIGVAGTANDAPAYVVVNFIIKT
jgi:microcystin-dependent protein